MIVRRGLLGMHFAKVVGGKVGKLDLSALFILLETLCPHYDCLRLLQRPHVSFLSFSSCPADQTSEAVDFRGVALPLSLIWSASTSWWRLFTYMLTCGAFLGQGSAYGLAQEWQQNAAFCLVTLQGLFHQGLNLRCTTFCISFLVLICILSEASCFPVIHIYDPSEYMVIPFSVISQCY